MSVKMFFCYAHEDEVLLNRLKTHLKPLERQGLIEIWYDREINAGSEWEREISKHLDAAQIIILLVSPDFLNSEYCYGTEMKRALERHKRGEARVVPVILRSVYWQGILGQLQALPKNGLPITDPEWHNWDRALYNVTEGLRSIVVNLNSTPLVQEKSRDELQISVSPPSSNQSLLENTKPKPEPSSRQPLKLLLPLLLIVSIVVTGGGLWVLATHNQTPTPSITPTPFPGTRLTMAKTAPTVYNDALNNPDNQNTAVAAWDITTQCSFSSSGYRATTYKRKPAFCHERNNTYQDAFISVDAVIVSGASAGLLFRDQFSSNASGAYFFEVGSNGKYKISTVPFAVQRTLKNWTQASAIRTGQGVKNTLQVIAQGNTLFFYINGSFLTEELDGEYRNGSISLACYTGSSSETEAIFSNLEVHKLS